MTKHVTCTAIKDISQLFISGNKGAHIYDRLVRQIQFVSPFVHNVTKVIKLVPLGFGQVFDTRFQMIVVTCQEDQTLMSHVSRRLHVDEGYNRPVVGTRDKVSDSCVNFSIKESSL
jgi:hypothetical protein